MDYTVHGILQARILEWVASPFSTGSSQPRDQTQVFLHYRVFSSIPGFYPLEMPVANSQLPSVTKISLVAQMVKNLPAMREAWFGSLGWEDPLEKGTDTHSSILAWRIPWTV